MKSWSARKAQRRERHKELIQITSDRGSSLNRYFHVIENGVVGDEKAPQSIRKDMTAR